MYIFVSCTRQADWWYIFIPLSGASYLLSYKKNSEWIFFFFNYSTYCYKKCLTTSVLKFLGIFFKIRNSEYSKGIGILCLSSGIIHYFLQPKSSKNTSLLFWSQILLKKNPPVSREHKTLRPKRFKSYAQFVC